MNNLLYPRLAWQNLSKNRRFYYPYMLTIIGTAAAFYILLALSGARDLPEMERYSYLAVFVSTGTVVVGLFAIIFLFYTNSFLMKQRKKELGLYNILGMGKRHIAKVLAFETLYTAAIAVTLGVLFGMLFQKAVTALLFRLIRFDGAFGFYVAPTGVVITYAMFGGILFLNLLFNLRRIHVQNPIELLREGAGGEREPRTRWLLTLLGIVTLGGGYAIAITARSAVEALSLYFVAVILVIIGTFCLFTSVSIAVLKLLRKNKRFYYRTANFIGISSMLYRMKRNAVGLANICILSTMVLVMVSGTLSLYVGSDYALREKYPMNTLVRINCYPEKGDPLDEAALIAAAEDGARTAGREVLRSKAIKSLLIPVDEQAGGLITASQKTMYLSSVHELLIITAEDYAAMGGEAALPESGEALLYSKGGWSGDTFTLGYCGADGAIAESEVYAVKEITEYPSIGVDWGISGGKSLLVVADEGELMEIYGHKTSFGDAAGHIRLTVNAYLEIDGSDEQQIECARVIEEYLASNNADFGAWETMSVAALADAAADFYYTNGGFFFLGLFLGLIFIMAAALIIYYKQITEGYEDRERFRIMREVGLDRSEIRRSTGSQIRFVFFAPLAVAAVHVAFDFRLVQLLLTLFGLNIPLVTLVCTLVTLVAFAAIYGAVYARTARSYYKIVS